MADEARFDELSKQDIAKVGSMLDDSKPLLSGLNARFDHGVIMFGHSTITSDGPGTTSRTFERLEDEIPNIRERIDSAEGKVAFIGNGFSNAPVYAAERFKMGLLSTPPVVHDLFDYKLAYQDLTNIYKKLDKQGLGRVVETEFKRLQQLISCIDDGSLIPVNYTFGEGRVPEELLGTELAINSHGPPSSTIEEQLSILKDDGELLISIGKSDMDLYEGYTVTPIQTEDESLVNSSFSIKKSEPSLGQKDEVVIVDKGKADLPNFRKQAEDVWADDENQGSDQDALIALLVKYYGYKNEQIKGKGSDTCRIKGRDNQAIHLRTGVDESENPFLEFFVEGVLNPVRLQSSSLKLALPFAMALAHQSKEKLNRILGYRLEDPQVVVRHPHKLIENRDVIEMEVKYNKDGYRTTKFWGLQKNRIFETAHFPYVKP